MLLLALICFGFFTHLNYLRHNCPIDLSGDEAHYWDWSRQLDINYYSKGPLVAYIIRASCAVFGDQMWAVRFPALILAAATTMLTYSLTKRLFGSEKLALGAVLLYHLVPVFVAGSLMMTIDPPFFFCWAAATLLLARATDAERAGPPTARIRREDAPAPLYSRWPWLFIGFFIGVGILAKWGMLLFPVSMLVYLYFERRALLKTIWPWLAIAVGLLFLTPAIVWNAQHNWVTLHHVTGNTGADGNHKFSPVGFPIYLFGQLVIVGPAMAVMLIAAIVITRRTQNPGAKFLLWIGGTFFVIVSIAALTGKAQPNWPAPAYFTLMILTAWFISTRLQSPEKWRPWRWWFYGGLASGIVMMPFAHNMTLAYPLMSRMHLDVKKIDPTTRLYGWNALGQRIGQELQSLPSNSFVICDDYQLTAETAFYTPGQPKTYYMGSYFSHHPKRFSQYDIWPDRSLEPDKTSLLGRNAIYVGYNRRDLAKAFEKVDRLPDMKIFRDGVYLKKFQLYRCSGFRGISRPAKGATY